MKTETLYKTKEEAETSANNLPYTERSECQNNETKDKRAIDSFEIYQEARANGEKSDVGYGIMVVLDNNTRYKRNKFESEFTIL